MKLQSYGLHKDKSSKWNNYVNKETKGKICVCDTLPPQGEHLLQKWWSYCPDKENQLWVITL